MVEVTSHIGCPESCFLMFWLCARASFITELCSSNLCLRPPEIPALSVQEIRRWNKNGFLSWWGNDKRSWCPLERRCYHLKCGQHQKAGGCWFRQLRSNWAVPKDQTNWADKYQNMSQPHAAAPLSHTLLCCIVQSVLIIFPHLLFFGSPPFYRDVNLATGWNNVTKRQVEMIYPQAMVASIESQLQHLSDDDDSSSLSAREERRLTRPQATAPC